MPNDYISRESVIADIEQIVENSGCVNHEREVIDCVRYATAADVVEVVRCRDCDHNGDNTIGKECVFCKRLETIVPLTHFCGYGSRMDGGEHHAD